MKNNIKLRRDFFDISMGAVTVLGIIILVTLKLVYQDFIPHSLVLGAIIYLGLALPRWQSTEVKTKRENRIRDIKEKELATWGFHSRDREGPWLNYIDYPLVKATQYAQNKWFYSEWLIIYDGYLVVNPGAFELSSDKTTVKYDFSVRRSYAWDGCTPKRWFFWLTLIGTPDGMQKFERVKSLDDKEPCKDKEVFWQRAHHASLVHDALYQYLDSIPIAKQDVDKLFYEMLVASAFPSSLAKLYHFAVRHFGAREIAENNPKPDSKLLLDRVSRVFLEQLANCSEA